MKSQQTATLEDLKLELAKALAAHVGLLKNVDSFDVEHIDALTFVMRSLGFMLDKTPCLLLDNQEEEVHFAMFQYYSLLAELKRNVAMSYPYTKINHVPLTEVLETFPNQYQQAMNNWWEAKTGLEVHGTKQTLSI